MAHDDIFSALADPTRRRLLEALREDSCSVGSLVEALGVSQPTVSKHLKVLREAGLVSMRADGQRRYYALEPVTFLELETWLHRYLPPPPALSLVPEQAAGSHEVASQATVAAAQLGRTVGRGLEQVTGRAQDFLERFPKPKFGRKR
ncbi:transcriptional regulator [Arthrobacter sp. AQ5-05]|uniref:ArsR/SmtB family transcription factor n=1 Tax=Arthrobacter sp. AQ5-05 TaxID=2184581 RepID=UPI000DCE36D7|nr:metalloregulator ArsR/SmtB family transcription factor [Arthrobacter sp. AQ5-05]RAX50368.1 transcriptional regulator [Arthrobacter sp. AQ5-05]